MSPQISQKALILTVALLILAFFGYKIFLAPAPAPEEGVEPTATTVVGEDIITLVERLNRITIDASVFSSPLFSNLIDRSIPVTPETRGRTNPFALVGTDPSFPPTQTPQTSTTTPR